MCAESSSGFKWLTTNSTYKSDWELIQWNQFQFLLQRCGEQDDNVGHSELLEIYALLNWWLIWFWISELLLIFELPAADETLRDVCFTWTWPNKENILMSENSITERFFTVAYSGGLFSFSAIQSSLAFYRSLPSSAQLPQSPFACVRSGLQHLLEVFSHIVTKTYWRT